MSSITQISWTDCTDNIIRVQGGGWWCKKVSEGCANCYSEKLNQNTFFGGNELSYSGQPPELVLNTELIRKWAFQTKSKKHFVASMTDVFGEWVPHYWQHEMLDGMFAAPKQTFQILTKRPEIMLNSVQAWLDSHGLDKLPSNIWLGTSTENQQTADERIPILLQIPAAVRFLSCEPLLEAIDLSKWLICPECFGEQLWYERRTGPRSGVAGRKQCSKCKDNRFYSDLNWIIVGAESGNGARPSPIENIERVVTQSLDGKVPVFVKQLGQFPVTNSPDKFPKTELITREKYSRWCFEEATKLGFELEGMHFVKLSDKKGGDIAEFPPHLQIRQFPQF